MMYGPKELAAVTLAMWHRSALWYKTVPTLRRIAGVQRISDLARYL